MSNPYVATFRQLKALELVHNSFLMPPMGLFYGKIWSFSSFSRHMSDHTKMTTSVWNIHTQFDADFALVLQVKANLIMRLHLHSLSPSSFL